MEEVEAFFKTERVQLSPEDLDKITGGWSIFDPVKNALKDVGNWMYDNFIDPAVDGVVDAGKTVVDVAVEALGIHSGNSLSLTALATLKPHEHTILGHTHTAMPVSREEKKG